MDPLRGSLLAGIEKNGTEPQSGSIVTIMSGNSTVFRKSNRQQEKMDFKLPVRVINRLSAYCLINL
jgi:hypothetical protein